MKKVFLKRNKQRQSLICLKSCEMNNFLAILEFYAYYTEYKNAKFTRINVHGRTNVKCFTQTQLLWFCKDTAKVSSFPLLKIDTKSTHFLPAKKKILTLWIELQRNKIRKVSKSFIQTPSGRNLQIARIFSKNVNKEAT